MNSTTRLLLYMATGTGILSMGYFLSLVAFLPLLVFIPLIAAGLFFTFRWLEQSGVAKKEQHGSKLVAALFFTGVVIATNKIYYLIPKYGEWDAWAIWNFHARYLADAENWRKLFLNTYFTHIDYPLAVPATIGFFSRMLPDVQTDIIGYGFHVLITLCVPMLIFAAVYPRNRLVAGIALLWMVTNEFYLTQGISQYADTLLSFFFVSAFITIRYHYDKRMLALTAFLLGCCAWTKNEGIVLAGIFFLFYMRTFLYRSNVRYFLSGIALPLLTLCLFKVGFASANDIVAGQDRATMQQLLQAGRYRLIYDYLTNNLAAHFKLVEYATIIYLLGCALRKKRPEKQLMIILTCCIAYMVVYLITPHDLEWHLYTSQSRLLHQLMPAAMYALCICFTKDESAKGFPSINFLVRRTLR